MQQRSQQTHNRILTAAEALFARAGYDGAGVAEICRAAGISKGAFYHHFPSKHAVFMRLLEDWLAGLDQQLDQAVASTADIPQGLLEMAGRTRYVFESAGNTVPVSASRAGALAGQTALREKLPIFLEFWAQASRQPDVWRATMAPYRRYQQRFARLVASGIAEGALKPVDPDLGARLILALAIGMLFQGLLDPSGADWGAATRQGMQIVLEGLQKEPE